MGKWYLPVFHIMLKPDVKSISHGFSNLNYGYCPKISNTLFQTFGLNFAFYEVVSLNT